MSTQFPTALDTLTNPSATDYLNSPSHAGQHSDANDAIEAIEAKLGITSSAVTSSHDYKLSLVTGTAKALPDSYLDTDGTLAANSDSKLATQKAVKTYVDSNGGADWKAYASVVPTRSASASFEPVHSLVFAGVDLTSILNIGKKIKLTQTAGSNAKSLQLNGSSQYASKTDVAALSITGAITMEAWIQIGALAGAGQAICTKWNQDGNVKSWAFYINSDNQTLRFDYSGNGSNEGSASSTPCINSSDIGKWIHVAFVLTPSTKAFAFYKNGILVNSGTASGTQTAIYDGNNTFAIGARDVQGTPDTFFNGKIAEFRLWSVARTQAQIQGNMFHNLVGNEANLNGYWKFDNAYTDATSNGNTLTASGSPTFASDVPAKLTNGTKYGIINSVAFSTDTTVIVDFGTDYGIDDGTISAFNYSSVHAPLGFPMNPNKWTITLTDVTDRSQATPAQNTWYNLATIFINLPVGAWNVLYSVVCQNTTAAKTVQTTLSTANNSESNTESSAGQVFLSANERNYFFKKFSVLLAANTPHYFNTRSTSASSGTISNNNSENALMIKAVNAYL